MDKTKGTITLPSVFMYALADSSAEVSDELLYGTVVTRLEELNGFIRCKTDYGYCGYIKPRYVSCIRDNKEAVPYMVKTVFADLLAHPIYKHRPVITLPKGSTVYCTGRLSPDGGFYEVLHRNGVCFAPLHSLYPMEEPRCSTGVLRKKICDDALMYLGSPYRWGGKSPQGIDCSGLCFMSYFLNGITIWRDSFADSRFVHEIPQSKALEGDIIYFKGHAAIYIGDGEYVHSSASAGCVTVSSLNKGSIIYRADLADKLVCFARSNML